MKILPITEILSVKNVLIFEQTTFINKKSIAIHINNLSNKIRLWIDLCIVHLLAGTPPQTVSH